MRLTSIEISGFRAFSGSYQFDLDGDVLLVVGTNGQGKTSLLDAIHWGLTGEISRLNQPGSIVSLYSPTGEARVEITIASDDDRQINVTRHFDGQQSRVLLKTGTKTFRGNEAEIELIRCIWPEGLATNDPRKALRSALERGVYLQQDVLTGFLTADTDQDRFNAISELIGSGHTTEFQGALERSRKSWSETTNQQVALLGDMEARQGRLQAQLRELTNDITTTTVSPLDWTTWWTEVKRLGVSVAVPERRDSSDAPNTIDAAMSELRALRFSHERRGQRLLEIASDLRELPTKVPDVGASRQTSDRASRDLEVARLNLTEAEDSVAEFRNRQSERHAEEQELKILFDVALRHLGKHCPVCQQTYDLEVTRRRLESRLAEPSRTEEPPKRIPNLARFITIVREKEKEAAAALETLRNATRLERAKAEGQTRIREGLTELGIYVPEMDGLSRTINSALEENERVLGVISKSMSQGESLALSLARTGQLARRVELEQEIQAVDLALRKLRIEIKTRIDSGALATGMIEGLRDISSLLVEQELARIEPLLQRIYATADPHPEFRVVRFLSRMHRGRGRLMAEVADLTRDHRSDAPEEFLSSSQLNVLAVSVFLALNLGLQSLPLRAVILDDPLQSLDDLNLLGLIDLLKRMRVQRQLLISTHDVRFASLLERKLRPVADSQRTILIGLNGWSREGPFVVQRDVNRDPTPIRIPVAA